MKKPAGPKPLSARGASAAQAVTESLGAYWLDVASRMLVGGFFALCAVTYLKHAMASLHGMDLAHPTLGQSANVVSVLALMFFMGLVAYLYAVRLPPLTKFAGWLPAAAAVLGSFTTFGLLLLHPRMDLAPSTRLVSSGLIIAGNIFAIYSLRYLGRSFSILPQGRRLVTGGPYRFIRHPVYLAEAIATMGAMINFLSFPAFALVVAQLFCQLLRMHFEEKVLATAFPEYEEYRRHTKRVLPGIY